jgi:Tol biopolymer transport system component
VVSPDGSWILYVSTAPGSTAITPVRIMRVPTSGGAPQLVLEGRGISGLACARSPAALCVFSEESPDRKQLIFSAFEPSQEEKKPELTRVNLKQPVTLWGYGWDLSRDGSRLAFTQFDASEGRIQILSSAGGEAREVNVKGRNNLNNSFWAADGKHLLVGMPLTRSLLTVDLEGRAEVLWQQRLPGRETMWAVPSPDGRHLALLGYSADNNVWLLENF